MVFFKCFFSILFYSGIVTYDPLRASSYIPLSKEISQRKACINIQNFSDEKCFLWCVLASLYPAQSNAQRVSKYKDHENKLNMEGINYPVRLGEIKTFEHKNQISVNVYGEENNIIFPIFISNLQIPSNHHVDLLYINKESQGHYILIKDLSKLVGSQISKNEHKKYFCRRCLQAFTTEAILKKHLESCSKHDIQNIKMPKEGSILKFKKIDCSLRHPFVIYCDFESCLHKCHHAERNNSASWTEAFQEHHACSFALHVVSTDKRYYTKPKLYFGDDAGEVFLDMIGEEIRKIKLFLDHEIPIINFTREQQLFHDTTNQCHICQKEILPGETKVFIIIVIIIIVILMEIIQFCSV